MLGNFFMNLIFFYKRMREKKRIVVSVVCKGTQLQLPSSLMYVMYCCSVIHQLQVHS
jgi:hypothetical protein